MQDSIRKLFFGYNRFKDQNFSGGTASGTFDFLAQGQHPFAVLIGCSDSRVIPEAVFDCKAGEIFVVRNVANIVPPSSHNGASATAAALAYAVGVLRVPHIIVMGHSGCGGARGVVQGLPEGQDFPELKLWLDFAESARPAITDTTDDKIFLECELGILKLSYNNLLSYPFVRNAVEANSLALHALHFGFRPGMEGRILAYDPGQDTFLPWEEICKDSIFAPELSCPGF